MGGSKRSTKGLALRNALVALRQETGLTQRAFADKYGLKPGTWARYETGERRPDQATLDDILDRLAVTAERRAAIIATAQGTDEPRWVAVSLPEQRAQLAAFIDFESTADRITVVSPLLIPGLAQTSDYIRALMVDAGVQPSELSTLVAVRVGRRDVITRHDPADLQLLIGEAALRQVIGDREIMTRQLRYVIELTELPNVEVRVLPFTSGWHAGLEGPFTMFDSDGQSIVHIENRRSGLFLHEDEDVELYRDAVRDMVGGPGEKGRKVAMSPAASTELIAEIAHEMEA